MSTSLPIDSIDLEVRVRYCECDPMNVVHHSVYPIWMEMARTEMLRRRGNSYRVLQAAGIFFVVARMNLRFRRSAHYDDVLRIHVETMPTAVIKVVHRYKIYRDRQLLAEADTTLVCVDGEGRPKSIPSGILGDEPGAPVSGFVESAKT